MRGSRNKLVLRGISLPLRIEGGRVALTEGPEQLKKIIVLSILSGDSSNPFLPGNTFDETVFSTDGKETRSLVTLKIRELFDRLEFEERAKLLPGYPTFEFVSDGVLYVTVKYFDIKLAEEEELRLGVPGPTL